VFSPHSNICTESLFSRPFSCLCTEAHQWLRRSLSCDGTDEVLRLSAKKSLPPYPATLVRLFLPVPAATLSFCLCSQHSLSHALWTPAACVVCMSAAPRRPRPRVVYLDRPRCSTSSRLGQAPRRLAQHHLKFAVLRVLQAPPLRPRQARPPPGRRRAPDSTSVTAPSCTSSLQRRSSPRRIIGQRASPPPSGSNPH
jgi:hypothetical protein